MLTELREHKAINPHGRDGKVMQYLKSVSLALFCVGLLEEGKLSEEDATGFYIVTSQNSTVLAMGLCSRLRRPGVCPCRSD